MSAPVTPDVIDRVTERIDRAIRRNIHLERLIIGILVTLFLSGIGLVIGGVVSQRWECFIPGGLAEVAIIFPIQKLTKLREDNLLYETFPALLRMANTTRTQELPTLFLGRLIERMQS